VAWPVPLASLPPPPPTHKPRRGADSPLSRPIRPRAAVPRPPLHARRPWTRTATRWDPPRGIKPTALARRRFQASSPSRSSRGQHVCLSSMSIPQPSFQIYFLSPCLSPHLSAVGATTVIRWPAVKLTMEEAQEVLHTLQMEAACTDPGTPHRHRDMCWVSPPLLRRRWARRPALLRALDESGSLIMHQVWFGTVLCLCLAFALQ
jgi:hypothetical protein